MNANNGPRPCGFATCPAFALDEHEFCRLHSPDQVQARARQIVCNEFADALMQPLSKTTSDLLIKLRADVIHDLDNTV